MGEVCVHVTITSGNEQVSDCEECFPPPKVPVVVAVHDVLKCHEQAKGEHFYFTQNSLHVTWTVKVLLQLFATFYIACMNCLCAR